MRIFTFLKVSFGLVALTLFCEQAGTARSEEIHWTGNGGDYFWNNSTNWDLSRVPVSGDDVFIDLDGSYTVRYDGIVELAALELGATSGSQTLEIVDGSLRFTNATILGNGVLSLSGGVIVRSNLAVHGTLDWPMGSLTGGGMTTIEPDGILNFTGEFLKKLNTHTLVNYGTVIWGSYAESVLPGGLTGDPAAQFINQGLFLLQTSCNLNVSGVFINAGTMRVPDGNAPTFLHANMSFTNIGVLEVGTNAVFDLMGNCAFGDGTVFEGDGLIRLRDGEMIGDGTLTVDNTVQLFTASITGNQIWTGPGRLDWLFGTMWGAGTSAMDTGFHLNFVDGGEQFAGEKYLLGHTLVNYGTVTWNSNNPDNPLTGLSGDEGAQFINQGLFVLQTDCDLDESGLFINAGTMRVLADSGAIVLNANMSFTNIGVLEVGTNTVFDLMGNCAFGDGTVFEGEGLTRLRDGEMIGEGTLTVNGTVELFSASITGNQIWTGTGRLDWLFGTMWGAGTSAMDTGFHLNFTDGGEQLYGEKYLLGHTLVNYGTVTWNSYSLSNPLTGLTGDEGAQFINQGLFLLQTNCSLDESGLFINAGTLRVPAESGLIFLQANMGFTNVGIIEAETDAMLDLRGNCAFGDGTMFEGDGLIRLRDGEMIGEGTLTVSGTVELLSASMTGNQIWTGTGRLDWSYGTMWGAGTSAIDAGFRLNFIGTDGLFFGEKYLLGHTLVNYGTVTWNSYNLSNPLTGLAGDEGAQFINHGLFVLQTNCYLNESGVFSNAAGGVFRIAGHTAQVAWDFDNAGVLDLSTGRLELPDGNYAPTVSSTEIHALAGRISGEQYGLLDVHHLTPDGSLIIVLTNGFQPIEGDRFNIANYSEHTGAFPAVELPQLPDGLIWWMEYTENDGLAAHVIAPPKIDAQTFLSGGSFQFNFTGPEANVCIIEGSTNLVDWTILISNNPFGGSLEFTDIAATNFNHRFYRAHVE